MDGEELYGQGGFAGSWSAFILKAGPVPGGSELWDPAQPVSDGVFRPLYLQTRAAAGPPTVWPIVGWLLALSPGTLLHGLRSAWVCGHLKGCESWRWFHFHFLLLQISQQEQHPLVFDTGGFVFFLSPVGLSFFSLSVPQGWGQEPGLVCVTVSALYSRGTPLA